MTRTFLAMTETYPLNERADVRSETGCLERPTRSSVRPMLELVPLSSQERTRRARLAHLVANAPLFLRSGRRPTLDVGCPPRRSCNAAPGRPKDHREHEAETTHNHQDDADRLELETRNRDVHTPGQDCPDRDQKDADSNSHFVLLTEALTRSLNERVAHIFGNSETFGPLKFMCECGIYDCGERIELTANEYERSACHPDHVCYAIEFVVLEHAESYAIVEKVGAAGRLAIATDPRDDAGEQLAKDTDALA